MVSIKEKTKNEGLGSFREMKKLSLFEKEQKTKRNDLKLFE